MSVAFVALGMTACSKAPGPNSPGRIDAASMRRTGTVDERFQSYNIEMVEVVGGRFWRPYTDLDALLKAQSSVTQSNKDAGPSRRVWTRIFTNNACRLTSPTRACASLQRPWGPPM